MKICSLSARTSTSQVLVVGHIYYQMNMRLLSAGTSTGQRPTQVLHHGSFSFLKYKITCARCNYVLWGQLYRRGASCAGSATSITSIDERPGEGASSPGVGASSSHKVSTSVHQVRSAQQTHQDSSRRPLAGAARRPTKRGPQFSCPAKGAVAGEARRPTRRGSRRPRQSRVKFPPQRDPSKVRHVGPPSEGTHDSRKVRPNSRRGQSARQARTNHREGREGEKRQSALSASLSRQATDESIVRATLARIQYVSSSLLSSSTSL